MDHLKEQKDAGDASLSVVDRVLLAFTSEVTEREGLGDVGTRLADTLLVKKDFSEAALQRALFEVDQP